jgi:hypothetical protein
MSTSSRKTLDEILAQAQRLPEDEKQRLIADLQAGNGAVPTETRRQNAMKRWLARAGSGHADAADISTHKNDYLAESHATKS